MDKSDFKLGVLAYVAPPNLSNADAFFANMRNFPTKHPLIIYSDFDYRPYWPKAMVLNGTVDIARDEKNRMAINNLVFYVGLRIAANFRFTHVLILEHDCRVNQARWDEVIWNEFLSKNADAIMGGSMVVFNPCSYNREAGQHFESLLAASREKRLMPLSVCGTSQLAERRDSCVFPNGALAIYRMDWLLRTFPEVIGTPERYIGLSKTSTTWDYEIGLRLWKEFKENTYHQVVNLESIYSGYGNVMSTEEERQKWLTEGKIVGVHQIKSQWPGPDKKAISAPPAADLVKPVKIEPVKEAEAPSAFPKMRLFIVTYAKDYPYLEACLRSIKKFATGFLGTTILVPTKDVSALREIIARVGIENVKVKGGYEWKGRGMLWHLMNECRADEWCPDADYVAHFDADTIFTAPVSPLMFFKHGKPVLRHEMFESVTKREPGVANWKIAAELCLPFPVNMEGMRGLPHVYEKQTYGRTRQLIEEKTGQKFNDYVYSCRNEFPQTFCEYVTLSSVAVHEFPSIYHIHDCGTDEIPGKSPWPVIQFWGHGPIDQPQTIWIDGEKREVIPKQLSEEILK